ncbi:MAG: sugar-binding domain-containing protein, partial [Planctomycetota bacterium]
ASRGGKAKPLYPEDKGLSLDELQHRVYWRVKKVLELNDAGYGLEPWSGLNHLLNGFYDCMMIGESFQEADPNYYRNGHNALLTGCSIKMYGMRESSQNPYNIAMATVNLSDIQVCSGNGAWGDVEDSTETWGRVRPLWDILDSIDWENLIEARPWYAQELVQGEGFYAGNYTTTNRAIVFLANKTEKAGVFDVFIDPARLPGKNRIWRLRYCLGRTGLIGRLGDGQLRVQLPALHNGPIGIELIAEEIAAVPRADDGFRPSTRGKKLLCFRGPVVGDDEIHFDGVITGGPMVFYRKVDTEQQAAWAEKTAALDFGRHTDNFYVCYSYPGKTADDFDWFDEMDWIVENWRIIAAAAKKARFKGICFDTEYYEGLPLFCYEKMRHAGTKSFQAYRRQVFRRSAQIMRAASKEFPDVKILLLFGYSGSYYGVPQHPVSREKIYTLVSAFVDGLLSECGPEAEVYDMHEQAFSNRIPGSYARQRAMMTDPMRDESFEPGRYQKHHRAGFSFWADCWENASQGRPFDVKQLDNNYYTPDEFAYSLHHALAYSDGYVWMWPGVMKWWDRTAKTLDADGKEVQCPLPQGYIDALKIAHQVSVPEPPRHRKPNTYRNLPAHTQEGFADSETFDDLWNRYDFVEDLPVSWRFQVDPNEIGETSGWHKPNFNDRDWPKIKIREFWENQGYSPYDGAVWYRLKYKVPSLPEGKKVFLAFGAVSDEASVYINGKLRYASLYGENTRHKRFFVDVTDLVKSGQECVIAVRVWNVNWCGGIWKNVKLITGKNL